MVLEKDEALQNKQKELDNANQTLEKELAALGNQPKSNIFPSQLSAIQQPADKTPELVKKIEQLEQEKENIKTSL